MKLAGYKALTQGLIVWQRCNRPDEELHIIRVCVCVLSDR